MKFIPVTRVRFENVVIDATNGKEYTFQEVCDMYNVDYKTAWNRRFVLGWSLDEVFIYQERVQ